MDEFEFDDAVASGSSSSLRNSRTSSSPASKSTTSSSIRSSRLGKTKTARLQRKREARIEQIDKSVRFQEEESLPHDDQTSSICQSLGSSKRSATRRRRRIRSPVRSSTLSPSSSPNRSSIRSSLSSQSTLDDSKDDDDDVVVKGAGVNVWAVQDAGSYRMLLDDTLYLLSMIASSTAHKAEEFLWDLALLLSQTDKRRILWSQQQGEAPSSLLTSILDLVARLVPPNNDDDDDDATNDDDDDDDPLLDSNDDESDNAGKRNSSTGGRRRGQRDLAAAAKPPRLQHLSLTGYQAMACIVHFLSLDCTTANSITAEAARKHRLQILQHGPAIRGMSQLLLNLDELTTTTTAVDHVPPPDDRKPRSSSAGTSETSSIASASAASSNASSPKKRKDPTSSGRRRRKKRPRPTLLPLESILESPVAAAPHPAERLSFTDTSEPLAKEQNSNEAMNAETAASRKAEKVLRKVQWRAADTTCDCKGDDSNAAGSLFVKMVALQALNRIIQGKEEGDETSCLDEEEDEQSRSQGGEDDDDDEASAAKLEASSPLMVTNRLLLESHALPTISTAMSYALQECGGRCKACDHTTVTAIANLVDGACLLSDDNREELCLNGRLIGSILRLLEQYEQKQLLETALICMRTLTSLTHDNPLAGQQLSQKHDGVSTNGTRILLQLLHHMVTTTTASKNKRAKEEDDDDAKQQYDIIIFLLNTLTNVAETANVQKIMTTFVVPPDETAAQSQSPTSCLEWLARWIVDETSTFRKDVLEGSFGKQQQGAKTSSSYLHKDAEEHLVTAGNGFILLACLMILHSSSSSQMNDIREVILKATAGYPLIANTLRSFCNFYYYSVGDLSVAVVAPVKKLIVQLEQQEREANAGLRIGSHHSSR